MQTTACLAPAVFFEQSPGRRPRRQDRHEVRQRQRPVQVEQRQVRQVGVAAGEGFGQTPLALAQAQQQRHLWRTQVSGPGLWSGLQSE